MTITDGSSFAVAVIKIVLLESITFPKLSVVERVKASLSILVDGLTIPEAI